MPCIVKVANFPAEVAVWSADYVVERLHQEPELTMCVASGNSPLGLYRELQRRCADDCATYSKMRVMKLDEWGGLASNDPASCEYYVRKEVIDPLDISPDHYFTFDGDAKDADAECLRFQAIIEQVGPVGLCVLGMGVNGHLGLNEPAEWLHDSVHVAQLATESQHHGMLENARAMPTFGITLGMGDILRSRRVLLLVSGSSKREPMRQFLTRRITTRFPASLLWTHRDLTVICDRAAYPGD